MSREAFLPLLTDTPEFSVSRASLDKVELRLLDFILTGENAPNALSDLIRDAEFDHQDDAPRIFRTWNPSRRIMVDVASGDRNFTGFMPVFTGKLVGTIPNPNRTQFSLSAKLSVTRAILAQRLMRRLDRPAIGRGPYTLLIERSPPCWQDEYPLVNATNVLIGPDLWYSYAMSRPASAHLIELVTEIERAIVVPLVDVAQRHQVQTDASGVYSLRGAEVYWEFETPSPVSTVDLLSGKLTGVVNRSRITAQAVVLPTSEIIQQSRSVQIELGRKMWLRVYAKTNKRVRFEVFFGRDAITAANRRRRLTDHAALAALTDDLVKLASQRMTELFQEMSPPLFATTQATSADLLRAIDASHPDRSVAALVLDGLRHFRRVVPDGNPDLLAALRTLKRRRVMRITRRQRSVYGLTAQYESALDGLILPEGR